MARELLTARKLESELRDAAAEAKARNTRIKVRDGDNLILIVRPSGGATWVLQYRHEGTRKPFTLGAWPNVSLKTARELADDARELLAKGIDPNVKKQADVARKKAARATEAYTVRKLFEAWMEKKSGSDVYKGNITAAFVRDVLPDIGSLAPADVTRQQVLAILRKLEQRKALVLLRRVRMWLKQMYEFARDADLVAASPVPTGHLKSFMQPEAGNFPAITDAADVAPLMRAIRAYPHTVTRYGLLLSAHLWQRPSEIREAPAAEFDLDAAVWKIPPERMKKRREHWVPLSRQVVQLLRELFGVVGTDGHILPGRKYGEPISEATLGEALVTLGFKGQHTPHGFRAMARTILEEHLHIDARYLEKQLAHEELDKTKRAYNRAQYWPERVKVMQIWSDWLDQQQ